METKAAFLILFVFSVLLFAATRYIDFQFGYVLALHIGLLTIALYFLTDKNVKGLFAKLGIPGNLKTNAVYAICGLVLIFACLVVMTLALSVLGLNDQTQVAKIANQLPLIVLLLAVAIAPFSEEIFFRGLILTKIESFLSSSLSAIGKSANGSVAKGIGAFGGVALSSLIFAVLHVAYGSVAELVGAFVIGVILALVFRSSKSIVPGIAIHFIYNAMSVTVLRVYG